MCGPKEWHEHADGNEISPPSRTGCAGLPFRRLAGVLARGLGETSDVLSGDGGEGQTLTCPGPMAGCVVPRRKKLGERNAAGHDGTAALVYEVTWRRCDRRARRRRF